MLMQLKGVCILVDSDHMARHPMIYDYPWSPPRGDISKSSGLKDATASTCLRLWPAYHAPIALEVLIGSRMTTVC